MMEEVKKPPVKNGCLGVAFSIIIIVFLFSIIFGDRKEHEPYVSKASAETKAAFVTYADRLVKNSKGVILSLEEGTMDGIYNMKVSNNWYLSPDTDKEYFAAQELRLITEISKKMYGPDAIVVFTIYDEANNSVASSKFSGGMKIE